MKLMKLKISNIVLLGLYLISMTLTAKTAQNGKKSVLIYSDYFLKTLIMLLTEGSMPN